MNALTNWIVSEGRTALDFDGPDDHVVCGNLSLPNVSVSAWIKTSNGTRGIINKDDGTNRSFQMRSSANKLQVLAWYTSTLFDNLTSASDVITGGVVHVCFTYGSGSLTIYINGKQDATMAASGSLFQASSSLTIGKAVTATPSFLGVVYESMVHNRVLASNEILLLATRRGIAYETRQNRSYRSAAGFKPHWASQRSQIISGGSR
jgi:hypothetical protein